MKQILFRGAATALVTPMQPDGSLDLETLSRLTEWQIQSSISALVPCGTTGEAATLTDEERFTVIQTVAKTAAGRVPVIAGAGCNDTARAEQNCLAAAAAGADALLLVTPYYNKCTPKGLQSHFARLASATPLPVIIYNVPSRTGVTIDMESRRKLSKVDNIIGLKEASTDFSLIHQHLLELGDTLPLYSGNDDQVVPLLSLGGKGVISVLSNVVPRQTVDMTDAFFAGRVAEAARMQCRYLPLIHDLFCEANPIPVKAAISAMGFGSENLRLPLVPMQEENRQRMMNRLRQLGVNV